VHARAHARRRVVARVGQVRWQVIHHVPTFGGKRAERKTMHMEGGGGR
jgi:hypothetical protein